MGRDACAHFAQEVSPRDGQRSMSECFWLAFWRLGSSFCNFRQTIVEFCAPKAGHGFIIGFGLISSARPNPESGKGGG